MRATGFSCVQSMKTYVRYSARLILFYFIYVYLFSLYFPLSPPSILLSLQTLVWNLFGTVMVFDTLKHGFAYRNYVVKKGASCPHIIALQDENSIESTGMPPLFLPLPSLSPLSLLPSSPLLSPPLTLSPLSPLPPLSPLSSHPSLILLRYGLCRGEEDINTSW